MVEVDHVEVDHVDGEKELPVCFYPCDKVKRVLDVADMFGGERL